MNEMKPLAWIGSSLKDLRAFPEDVKDVLGFALHIAQIGEKHEAAKPLAGFGGSGVLEVIDDHDGDTYRAVYTVRFSTAVYVLHAFQKKAKRGIATPKSDIELIRKRLEVAASDHAKRQDEKR